MSSNLRSIGIVGGSLAGLRSAEALRAEDYDGSITIISAEDHLPYDRPPLSKQILRGTWASQQSQLVDEEKLSRLDITFLGGTPASAFNAETREVGLADGTSMAFDGVVIATGAQLRHLPGTQGRPHIYGLRTLDDAVALRDGLSACEPGSKVVLIGAGFIGQEIATVAVGLGHRVSLVEGLPLPLLGIVGEPVASALLALPKHGGAELVLGVGVSDIAAATDTAAAGVVVLQDGRRFDADVIVVGIGVTPCTEWLADSGLTLENGVVTNDCLIAAPKVTAAGDVARFHWIAPGRDELARIEHWQMAADGGAHAARSLLAGQDATRFSPIPFFWSDQWGKKIQAVGRPDVKDEVVFVEEPDDEGRFICLYRRGDLLGAALGVSRPANVMGYRALLERGASFDEALAHARA